MTEGLVELSEDQKNKIRHFFEQGNEIAVRKEMERAGLRAVEIVSSNNMIEIRLKPPPDPGITATKKGEVREVHG